MLCKGSYIYSDREDGGWSFILMNAGVYLIVNCHSRLFNMMKFIEFIEVRLYVCVSFLSHLLAPRFN